MGLACGVTAIVFWFPLFWGGGRLVARAITGDLLGHEDLWFLKE